MIKLDYDSTATLPGRRRRAGGHQPVGDRPRADRQRTRRARVRGVRRRPGAAHQGRHQAAGARASTFGRQLPPRLRRRRRRASRPTRSTTSSRSTASSRSSSNALEQPLTDSSPEFVDATAAYDRARHHGRTPARASSTATSTPASGPSTRRSPTRATCPRRPGPRPRVQLRRQPADPGQRPVRLPEQADRRRALHRRLRRRRRATTPSVRRHRPRRRRPRHPHLVDVGRQHRRARRGPRRRPRHHPRHRAGRLGHRVQGVRPGRLLRLRLGRRGRSRRSSTASTSSTSRSPAAPSRSATRSSSPSSTRTPRASSSRPRPATTGPGAGTANHLSPWVTTRRRVDADARVRDRRSTSPPATATRSPPTGPRSPPAPGPLPVVLAGDVPGYERSAVRHEPPRPRHVRRA